MYYVLVIIASVVRIFLYAVELAMLLRAIFSWFPMDPNKFTDLLYAITEPFIYPIRRLFQKMNWFQNVPLDIPFLVTYLLISAVTLFL
ncbi:MAG: YggT family protein [Clostridia bacterium]|nr:YggT family protein [Clostridia bacterium]